MHTVESIGNRFEKRKSCKITQTISKELQWMYNTVSHDRKFIEEVFDDVMKLYKD